VSTPETETIALDLTCTECGSSPRAGETWRERAGLKVVPDGQAPKGH
jgi:hypothetical protein